MKLYSANVDYTLYQGNMLDMLEVIKPETIDSIVTDPPYGLTSITKRFGKEDSKPAQFGTDGAFSRLSKGFMGKEWDGSGIEYNIDTWQKCYEVLKPGGYLLAFGGSRTFHRIACAIEDAGFEIRDTIMWLYGSGFPKSMNIGLMIDKKEGLQGQRGIGGFNVGGIQEQSNRKAKLYIGSTTDGSKQKAYTDYKSDLAKQWQGWGTALKPSFEPIIVARKPFKGSLVDNVLEYGVGGINIDECRVGTEIITQLQKDMTVYHGNNLGAGSNTKMTGITTQTIGRFPANTILTYDETDFDEVCGEFPNTKSGVAVRHNSGGNTFGGNNKKPPMEDLGYFDSGSASRYFYCAKASKKDRDEGLDNFETKKTGELQGGRKEGSAGSIMLNTDGTTRVNPYAGTGTPKKNTHPTVKPTELMQYLVRLVTPNGGTILDPFNGSGSTGKAVMYENRERNKNYKYIGIELTEEYLPIAKARIEYVSNLPKIEKEKTLFDLQED